MAQTSYVPHPDYAPETEVTLEVTWTPNLSVTSPVILWLTDDAGRNLTSDTRLYTHAIACILRSAEWHDARSGFSREWA